MPAHILATKLFIPIKKRWTINRSRLVDKLDCALLDHLRFVLVSAPAGYGKTSLLCEWIQRTSEKAGAGCHFAWVSLDAADNDPVRFWSYVIAAIDRALGDKMILSRSALEVLEQDPDVFPQVLERLLNDLATLVELLILVLDDYHLLTEPQIHEKMALFLERQPHNLMLVIATRADPALPLSRLRVRGEMLEIRTSDLMFNSKEAKQFFEQSIGLALPEQDVELLEKRTEGWVAGLQLASLALQTSRPTQSGSFNPESQPYTKKLIEQFNEHHHLLVDYLMDEVLRTLPEAVQAFLLQTSILEKMCGSLCDAVLDRSAGSTSESSGTVLEQLERANLFLVPLDEERKWYRYHALFGGLLKARLQAQFPDMVPRLHHRAAQWYEKNGYPLDAAQHALATNDFNLAAGTIQRLLRDFVTWGGGRYTTALRWLRALPAEILEKNLNLGLYTCIVLYASGMIEAGESLLMRVERAVGDLDLQDTNTPFLSGYTAAIRALYANLFGQPKHAVTYAEKALQLLSGSPITPWTAARMALGRAHLLSGNVSESISVHTRTLNHVHSCGVAYLAMNLSFLLAEALIAAGRLREARETCRQALQQWDLGKDDARNAIASTLELTLARIDYEQNHLKVARDHAQTALELSQRGGITDDFGKGRLLMAQILYASGDQTTAQKVLHEAVEYAKRERSPLLISLYTAHQARQNLALGEHEEAERWANAFQLPVGGEWLPAEETLTKARVQLMQGQAEESQAICETLLAKVEAAGLGNTQIEALALLALSYQGIGQVEKARQSLIQALRLGYPEGYARTFIDLGQSMQALLLKAPVDQRTDAALAEYRDRLLQQFRDERIDAADPVGRLASPGSQPLVETLTERELEVLRYVANGASNHEIAEQLVVSVGTVKAHLFHIMGKLGAKNRTETVALARKLGLLS